MSYSAVDEKEQTNKKQMIELSSYVIMLVGMILFGVGLWKAKDAEITYDNKDKKVKELQSLAEKCNSPTEREGLFKSRPDYCSKTVIPAQQAVVGGKGGAQPEQTLYKVTQKLLDETQAMTNDMESASKDKSKFKTLWIVGIVLFFVGVGVCMYAMKE